MLVRSFESADAEKISQLIIQNLRQVNIQYYSKEVIGALVPFYTSEKIIERSNHQLTLVCALENDLVGTASLDFDRVRNVFVDLGRHRSGIGKKLMGAIETHAQEQHLKKMHLLSGLSACGFYEKLGYKVVKRFDNDLNGIPLPVIQMEKTLVMD